MYDDAHVVSYDDVESFLYYTRDDLQALSTRADGETISLVDWTMDTGYSKSLEIEVQLLQAVENAVQALAIEVRETLWKLPVLAGTDGNYPEEPQDIREEKKQDGGGAGAGGEEA
ncbi:hypothetical protein Daus18300_000337 [Diaporthe australafricana]|uniref:Uncharacterized protein n=1 Tax=Diaporthe australafricana TaxID=127596 RepID=A0ABR3Y6C7_9PEZI